MKFTALLFTILAAAFSANAQSQTPPPQSTPTTASVSGTALYRERIALPQNAILEVVLEDTSLADAPAIRLGSFKKQNPGNPPFRFSIAYDPAKIIDTHTYNVRATLTVDGRLMFTSTSAHPVITKGNPTTVTIGLQHAMASTDSPSVTSRSGEAPDALENTYWKLTTLGAKPVTVAAGKREPNLILHPEGMRTEVYGGCNNFAGTYTVKGKELHFSALAGTLMACDDASMDIEKNFASALTETRTYRITGNHLDLFDEQGKSIAHFESRVMQ